MSKRSAILLAALLASTACAQSGSSASAGTGIGIDTAGIDKSAKPGDDFEQYANGAWRAKTDIPSDAPTAGVGYDVFKKAEANNVAIIEAALKANAAPGTDQRRIADWYTAYTDTAGIEKRGLAPIKPDLDAIAALKDKTALATMLGANIRADEDPLNATSLSTQNLFGLWITQALDNPAKTIPYVLQGGLGLPDRDYYVSAKPEMAAIRGQYHDYVVKLLTLAGFADAAVRADRVIALETKIAQAHEDIVTTQDVHKADNPWTRADFAKKAPGLDWDAFWKAAQLGNQNDFDAWQPGAIAGEAKLVGSEPLEAWQDWLIFHRLNQSTGVLPATFDAAQFEFYGHQLSGTPQQRTRDKRAIASVNVWLGDAVGKLYSDQYFPASSKADIQNMVHGIVAAFDKRIVNLTWMAPATKAEARKKLETLRVGVGYPETWRDYSTLEVKADDPLGNFRRAQALEYSHQLAKIGKPVDKGEWWMTPQTVNAVNLPLQNALNFPAAILQAPFYDPAADAAANYGAIGAVIGHEISHSFDNTGADFDSGGKLRNWWTPADLAHFKAAGAALVAQYNDYEPLPGLHINGQQTLGENIADVAGLTAAYEAYRASLGGKEAPVIGGLTGDQRFFLAFAQAWRQKVRDPVTRQQIATDGHSPDRFRAQTVRNLDAWYGAFGVAAGEKLYLAPDKRVHVW